MCFVKSTGRGPPEEAAGGDGGGSSLAAVAGRGPGLGFSYGWRVTELCQTSEATNAVLEGVAPVNVVDAKRCSNTRRWSSAERREVRDAPSSPG
eukprot:970062-Pleurochrysis_carterae.AAC.1